MKLKTITTILGGALALCVLAVSPVKAEAMDAEVTNESETEDYTDIYTWENMAAADVQTCANIRTAPSIDAERTGVLNRGCAAEVTGEENGWTKVRSGDVEGYIRSDLLAFAEEAYNLYSAKYDPEQELQTATPIEEHLGGAQAQQAYTAAVSSSELDLLAAIIQCEAGGESHQGKVAVGAVVLNRVRSESFPDTITDVVYQSGQFSPVASGILSGVLAQGARSDCYQAAQDALSGQNPVGDALYFNSGYGRGIQIGNQHFY